jgi:hypothetical protein
MFHPRLLALTLSAEPETLLALIQAKQLHVPLTV